MDLPAEPQIRWILRNCAALLQLGAEPVHGAILPTGQFFPDRFDGSPRSIGALLARIQEHAGLSDLKLNLAILTPEGEVKTSCSTSGGGCCGGGGTVSGSLSRVSKRADGSYDVMVPATETANPTILTTSLARAVAFMFMTEAEAYRGVLDSDREPLTDLAGVLLGFGVLLANGSYIYMKGCHGVSVQSATRMPADEVTLALAIFGKLFDVPGRILVKHLEPTPAEYFDEADAWAKSNMALLRQLQAKPWQIETGPFTILPARSLLARVLGLGSRRLSKSSDDDLADLEHAVREARRAEKPKADPTKAAKLAELRALVDESLEGDART